jgi:hypothetical protein
MNKIVISLLVGYIIFQEYLIYGYSQLNQTLQTNIMELIMACLAATT